MMYSMIPFGRYHGGLDTIFDDLERSFFPPANRQPTAFRTDIRDEGDHFLLEAELPGFQKEDIHLELKEGVLTISAQHEEKQEKRDDQGQYLCRERRVGSFVRSLTICPTAVSVWLESLLHLLVAVQVFPSSLQI